MSSGISATAMLHNAPVCATNPFIHAPIPGHLACLMLEAWIKGTCTGGGRVCERIPFGLAHMAEQQNAPPQSMTPLFSCFSRASSRALRL